jgi:hypothetical protein
MSFSMARCKQNGVMKMMNIKANGRGGGDEQGQDSKVGQNF